MELVQVYKLKDIVLLNDDELDEVFYHIDLKEYRHEDIDSFIKAFNDIKQEAKYSFRIIIEAENRNFTDLEFDFFIELKEKLKLLDLPLSFKGGYKDDYSLEQLLKTDKALDKFINHINDPSLSPLEKYLIIYTYLANKKYKREDDENEFYKPRDIISIMNSDYIVCEGYGNLMQYLCQNVGITCIPEVINVGNNTSNKHMNNLVYIDDEKYDVHGLYYSDVTWDNVGSNDGKKEYAFCLIPMSDVKRINAPIDVAPFFLMFHDPHNCLLKVIDSDESNLVGYYIGPRYYVKSYAEDMFDITDKVQLSYEEALKIFINNRKNTIPLLIGLLKEKEVPSDIYDKNMFAPFGSTLPLLLAILCFNKKATGMVNSGIDRLLEHANNPLDGKDRPLEGENLPFCRNINVYASLEALESLKDEELNKTLFELQELDNKRRQNDQYDPNTDLDMWFANKRVYGLVLDVIDKLRNILLFRYVRDMIKDKFPHGRAISLETFEAALSNALLHEGLDLNTVKRIVSEAIDNSIKLAKVAYKPTARNCFRRIKKED